MSFKKVLINELSKLMGRFVAENMVAQFMLRKHIIDIDSKNENYQIRFLDDFLDSSIAKFTESSRTLKLRQQIINTMFADNKQAAAKPLLGDLMLHEIVNDPADFLTSILGRYCAEEVLKANSKNIKNMTIRQQIINIDKVLNEIFGSFYDEENLAKVHSDFIQFLRGKYKQPDIKKYHIQRSRPEVEKETLIKGLVLDYFKKNTKEDFSKVKKKILHLPDNVLDMKHVEVEKETRRFMVLHFGFETSKIIMSQLKHELKIYKLEYASLETRKKFFEKLMDEHFSNITSVGKLGVIRSQLIKILGIRSLID